MVKPLSNNIIHPHDTLASSWSFHIYSSCFVQWSGQDMFYHFHVTLNLHFVVGLISHIGLYLIIEVGHKKGHLKE